MLNLVSAIQWWVWLIVGIVGAIIYFVVMVKVNREFRARYDFSLYGGGFLMLIAEVGIVLAIVFRENKIILIAGLAVAALLILITLIYNIKRLGGVGGLALICQLLFSVCSLFAFLNLFSREGRRSLVTDSLRDDFYVRRRRRELEESEEEDRYY